MALALVVMGVSGSGKSAVSEGLAHRLGLRALDGDDLHTPQAVEKMRAGTPLCDADRWPWLDRVGQALAPTDATTPGTVVACSALRRVYRDRLRSACPGVRFIFLDGEPAVIAARMSQRRGHYMPSSLLQSQLETLERPGPDETDVLRLNVAQALDRIVEQACTALQEPSAYPMPPQEPRPGAALTAVRNIDPP